MVIVVIGLVCIVGIFAIPLTAPAQSKKEPRQAIYQGKPLIWWVKKSIQNKKNSNARGKTIRRLRKTIRHNPTINECVKLSTIIYSRFSESRAWEIIYHESWTSGKQYAKNPDSTASGLMQFLTSTWATTPFGRAGISIWSICGQTLAAGWMHQVGRGREWNY